MAQKLGASRGRPVVDVDLCLGREWGYDDKMRHLRQDFAWDITLFDAGRDETESPSRGVRAVGSTHETT